MNDVEKIKRDGAARALKSHISYLQSLIHQTWEGKMKNGKYQTLGVAIDTAENYLADMRETFTELQKLEKGHF